MAKPLRDLRIHLSDAGWGVVLPLALGLLTGPARAHGQERGTVEFHLGRVSSDQLWTGSFSTDRVKGVSFGAAVDVPTPLRGLSVRVGLGYVRRGSVVWDSERDPDRASEARVSSHYLALPLQGKLALSAGPVSVYGFAGPMLDLLLDTGCTAEFCHLLREDRMTVLGAGAGVGIAADLADRVRGGVELQVCQSISEAYLGEAGDVRNRSVELRVILGLPL